jgi:hypothetical protein
MKNIYLENNLSIKVGDRVKIDGIDSEIIFEFNKLTSYSFDLLNSIFNVNVKDFDSCGSYFRLKMFDNTNFPSSHSNYFCRYTLSKVGSLKHIDINKIKIGYRCIIGKDIELAPKITNLNQIKNHLIRNGSCNRFKKDKANDVVNEQYIIKDIYNDYVLISSVNKSETYVFPYWFLYSSNMGADLYKPKPKIIRNFDEF